MSPNDDPKTELHAVAAGIRAWLDWQAQTGAIELPVDPPRPTAAPNVKAQPAAPTPAPPPSPATPARAPRVASPRPAPRPAPAAPATGSVSPGAQGLEAVRVDLGDCQRCRLGKERKNLVYGVGDPAARLVLVGEAPGQQEDATGEPFVGRSGQLLTRMLATLGFERSQVYICNVIKCRPPQNRDPMPDEVHTCSPFLHRQLKAIGPRVVLTLGRFAAANLMGRETGASMGDLRREQRAFEGIPIVATYHPSYLLRTPIAKRAAWDDLLKVRALLDGP